MNTPCRLLLVAGLFWATVQAQSDNAVPGWIESLHLTASGNVSWINNLSRTSYAPTSKDGTTFEFNLNSSQSRQLAPSLLLVATGKLSSLSVQEYDLDNNLTAGGSLALQKKFGLGPMAPVLQFNLGTSYKSARLDDDCGWTTEAGVQLAQRVLPHLRLTAAARWLEHNAKSATFDLNQHSYSFEAQWDITTRWTLTGSVGRLQGEVVANAAWFVWAQAISGGFGETVRSSYTSRPWSVTNAYGDGWVAYNVEGDVDLWSVSAAYALSDHTSLALEKSAAFVVNQVGIRYPTDAWSLRLVHRF